MSECYPELTADEFNKMLIKNSPVLQSIYDAGVKVGYDELQLTAALGFALAHIRHPMSVPDWQLKEAEEHPDESVSWVIRYLIEHDME